MDEVLLRATALVAGYDAPVAGPLDFDLRRGEILGLAGPNGAGKSTLLNILARTVSADDGTVTGQRGARIVRVHDVRETAEALKVFEVVRAVV